MKTYRNATVVLLCLITAVCVITVAYSAMELNRSKGVFITYGPPTIGEENEQYPINVNTATADELMLIDGIGETKAAAIIAYREQTGAFGSVDDLLNVPGIGEKTLESIREYICV